MDTTVITTLITAFCSIIAIIVGLKWKDSSEKKKFKLSILEQDDKNRIELISLGIESIQKVKNELRYLDAKLTNNPKYDLSKSLKKFETISMKFDECYERNRASIKRKDEYSYLHALQPSLDILYKFHLILDEEHRPGYVKECLDMMRDRYTKDQDILLEIRNKIIKRM